MDHKLAGPAHARNVKAVNPGAIAVQALHDPLTIIQPQSESCMCDSELPAEHVLDRIPSATARH